MSGREARTAALGKNLGNAVINYDGPKALFAITKHPKQVLEDVQRLRAAVAEAVTDRAALLAEIDSLRGQLRVAVDLARTTEDQLANLRAKLT